MHILSMRVVKIQNPRIPCQAETEFFAYAPRQGVSTCSLNTYALSHSVLHHGRATESLFWRVQNGGESPQLAGVPYR